MRERGRERDGGREIDSEREKGREREEKRGLHRESEGGKQGGGVKSERSEKVHSETVSVVSRHASQRGGLCEVSLGRGK